MKFPDYLSVPIFQELREHNANRVRKAREGSRVAMVELHCIHCTGEQKSSHAARRCENTTCPLWPAAFRRGQEGPT